MYIALVWIHSFGGCHFAWLFGGCVWLTCIVCGTVGGAGGCFLETVNFYGEGTGGGLVTRFAPLSLQTTDAVGEGVSCER